MTPFTLFQTAAAARRATRRLFGVGSLVSSSTKTLKSRGIDVETLVIYLPAASRILGESCCPASTVGCRRTCLGYHSGRMVQKGPRRAQRLRVPAIAAMLTDPNAIGWEILAGEIRTALKRCAKKGRTLAFRFNGTSDLDWPSTAGYKRLRAQFPDVVFYDYTKRAELTHHAGHHWTLSATEKTTDDEIRSAIARGVNVAIVFKGSELPPEYLGFEVINGDAHDYRPADPVGKIVGLLAKGGPAKRDETGFAREAPASLQAAA